VKLTTLGTKNLPNENAIAKKVKNEHVFVITFAQNGQLPGKATIKIKLDGNWLSGKNKNNIYIYYYNPIKNKVELIAKKLKVYEKGYVQFDITYCSDYFATGKDLVEAGILPKTGSSINFIMLINFGTLCLLTRIGIMGFRKKD